MTDSFSIKKDGYHIHTAPALAYGAAELGKNFTMHYPDSGADLVANQTADVARTGLMEEADRQQKEKSLVQSGTRKTTKTISGILEGSIIGAKAGSNYGPFGSTIGAIVGGIAGGVGGNLDAQNDQTASQAGDNSTQTSNIATIEAIAKAIGMLGKGSEGLGQSAGGLVGGISNAKNGIGMANTLSSLGSAPSTTTQTLNTEKDKKYGS
jgi:hypothetical protein